MVAMEWLTIAEDLPLRDEIIKEIRNLVIEDSETGYKILPTTPGVHDDLASSLTCCLVPLLFRNILERRPPEVVRSILPSTDDLVRYTGKQPEAP